MKWVNHISALLFAGIFLLSSTGVLILQTYCICSGNESLSLYITPESCENSYHTHHSHDDHATESATTCEDQCHEGCSSHIYTDDCGCSKPDVKYFKLVNFLTNEELKYTVPYSEPVILATLNNIIVISGSEYNNDKKSEFYSEPPPHITSTLEFLIQISQLKIPDIA